MLPVYYQMDTSRLSNRKSAEIGFCYFVLRKGQEHGESKENGEIGNIKVKPLKIRDLQQRKLTPEEIDKRVENFFLTHDFMTKGDFCTINGMSRTTASRHIKRLCEEGKLENKGLQKQPIYVLKKA